MNNGHGLKLHEDTVFAGVECLATLILDCGLFLPPAQVKRGEGIIKISHAITSVVPVDLHRVVCTRMLSFQILGNRDSKGSIPLHKGFYHLGTTRANMFDIALTVQIKTPRVRRVPQSDERWSDSTRWK